ncbi:hypothetical protein [Cohnella sp. 56]|uniref:hypothetical protein n=1 Tax=Cohnella sp. 56 TaxID=3113722 RepID=UPI0030E9E51A
MLTIRILGGKRYRDIVLAAGLLLLPTACGHASSLQAASEPSEVPAVSQPTPAVVPNAPSGSAAADAHQLEERTRPRLGGLVLGMNKSEAEDAIGSLATDSYTLPAAGTSVEMRDYGGMTVGYDKSGQVVYVETVSPDIPLDRSDIRVGSPAAEAAHNLSLEDTAASAELTTDVEGGILRLDIDRASGTVSAVKLIGQSLV